MDGGTDCETGEFLSDIPSCNIEVRLFDLETGETGDENTTTLKLRKTRFAIPKELIRPAEEQKKCCIESEQTYTLFKKEQVIGLQKEIYLGCNKTSHRLFLIPTLFCFMQICAPLIVFIEVALHVWAHRKNAKNTNANFYYRSPLHIVTAQFCAYCRNHSEMEQVSRLQDQRKKDWRIHLRDMAKSMY